MAKSGRKRPFKFNWNAHYKKSLAKERQRQDAQVRLRKTIRHTLQTKMGETIPQSESAKLAKLNAQMVKLVEFDEFGFDGLGGGCGDTVVSVQVDMALINSDIQQHEDSRIQLEIGGTAAGVTIMVRDPVLNSEFCALAIIDLKQEQAVGLIGALQAGLFANAERVREREKYEREQKEKAAGEERTIERGDNANA